MHKLMAVLLPLMIGVGPACACAQKMASPALPTPPASSEHACCEHHQQKPAQPPRNCEHCPIINRAHAVMDQSAQHAATGPLHWIAWALPPMIVPPAGISNHAVAVNESPPAAPADLFHLHCLLTL
jgi:hypothetical protein